MGQRTIHPVSNLMCHSLVLLLPLLCGCHGRAFAVWLAVNVLGVSRSTASTQSQFLSGWVSSLLDSSVGGAATPRHSLLHLKCLVSDYVRLNADPLNQ